MSEQLILALLLVITYETMRATSENRAVESDCFESIQAILLRKAICCFLA